MEGTTSSGLRRRTNRASDLLYLALSVTLVTVVFQLWSFMVRGAFHSHDTAAVLAASFFPVAALSMYTRLALGMGPMLIQLGALAVAVQTLPSSMPAPGLTTLVAGVVGALGVAMPTGRGTIVKAGVWAGAAAAAVSAAAAMPGGNIAAVMAAVLGSLVGGVLSAGAVLAASPFMERVFRQATTLTLLEALSYDHPLLRRLMTKAPGTFLHSTNLAVLTDAAARAIGADTLTVRVGALFHDVGKTAAPEHFVENQDDDGPDHLSTAERARVLRAHVTDGVALIQEYRLGDRVAEFVREHHGTSKMRSLIERARRDGAINPAMLRYPGPRPQSKETALLMIADQLEAAARSTSLPTLESCVGLARKTAERIKAEGQLAESGLSQDEIESAVLAFAGVLHAIHHRRFGYPEPQVTRPRARVMA